MPNGDRYGVHLPDVPGELAHLPEYLFELGTCAEGFNGPLTLNWTEVDAWARTTHAPLEPGEARALHLMSAAFVSIARQTNAPCPSDDVEVLDTVSEAGAASWKALGSSADG